MIQKSEDCHDLDKYGNAHDWGDQYFMTKKSVEMVEESLDACINPG